MNMRTLAGNKRALRRGRDILADAGARGRRCSGASNQEHRLFLEFILSYTQHRDNIKTHSPAIYTHGVIRLTSALPKKLLQ